MFQRTSTQSSRGNKRQPIPNQVLERSGKRTPLSFRVAQLEGDENDFGRGHRKIAFEKGLRRAEHHAQTPKSTNQLFLNHQLARFLAEDDPVPLVPPTATDTEMHFPEDVTKAALPPRRRLFQKKMKAQRLDINTREYRQPSEPAVQEIVNHTINNGFEENCSDEGISVLQGLGPHGTRYPTTFDITSLQSDTYFHSSTLIGSEDLQRALSVGQLDSRDLDKHFGYCTIMHGDTVVKCGPWNDETSSTLYSIIRDMYLNETHETIGQKPLNHLARFLRSFLNYVSTHLSFSDPFDRQGFVVKIHQILCLVFDHIRAVSTLDFERSYIRATNYLLVFGIQTYQIAKNAVVDRCTQTDLEALIHSIAKFIVSHVVSKGIPEISNFLETNKQHVTRQNGIQDDDVLVESVVVCMHGLEKMQTPDFGFWDLVSRELLTTITNASHIHAFESAWASLFTLVPFIEVGLFGIPVKNRKECFQGDNWDCISAMLRRILELYPSTFKKHGNSLNDYVRANIARCHRLIRRWQWQQPEQMLNAVFDFFGKNGLKPLRQEHTGGSASFLDNATKEEILVLEPNECSFHIALKCLVLGLRGMRRTYKEKKIRSFVFRTIPNHGRKYPKDQPLDEESLAALRNNHDLLCTLYLAAPSPCRPKLDHIQALVSHETSHREACRVGVRAWANLTTFQLSTDEPYTSAKPFALWHKAILHQTLKQYRLASTEAHEYLNSEVLDGTTNISVEMVKHTMKKNQEQVIATLRDCIAGMRRAMRSATHQTPLDKFIMDSEIVLLLELQHFEDYRLVSVIRDTLALIREYTKLQKVSLIRDESQNMSEESQDYGDFPDMDDMDDMETQSLSNTKHHNSLEFIESPLWHLLSNAFGAESSPDDNLLMECVDTWIVVADAHVASGARLWSFYLDDFSHVSWQQLRYTEQTRKFSPYFLASLIDNSPTAYGQHRSSFITALLLSLVDRESLLRFQHRLLHAVVRTDNDHPLMKNLPFFRIKKNGDWDITAETIRSRRLALISTVLSNMRDDLHATSSGDSRTSEVRRTYATMLKDFMNRMKNNYQQLQQGTTVTGAYVDFVQKIVQFLKQYTGGICPVLPFFTDSVAFPLPCTDPTYVVGRLCGYAPRATDPGTAKQLSVFIQTVAQQAAADSQQLYLVNQLNEALCSVGTPAVDRVALSSVLLQGIIPAYLEEAFSSKIAFVIAWPTLQSLQSMLGTMMLDLRVTQPDSVSSIVESIVAVSHAFIRGTERLENDLTTFEQPYILEVLAEMLKSMSSILPLLDYVCGRTLSVKSCSTLPLVKYMKEFSVYIAEIIHNMAPYIIPTYEGDAHATPLDGRRAGLLAFCKRGLEDSINANWSETAGKIWFGQGHTRREVRLEIGSLEDKKGGLIAAIEMFHATLESIHGDEHQGYAPGAVLGGDVIC
ncbi:Mus7/MMS22 family-domain-containing protein [Phaeosphaeriaceae sp. PMI808]|nr:Mus7/MMS22 family-domain-containing protein [Phaeosphaeriaceae sp. PMI808]